MLEIFPIPNPTLNLPDSVDKCKTDIKTYLLMQLCHFNFLICRFELFCRTVVTRDLNRVLKSPTSRYFVSYTKEPTVYENPYTWSWICVMLTFKSISFQISQHINIVFEVITWNYSINCAKITLFNSKLCKFVWKGIKGVRVLLTLVFTYFGNCSDMYLLVRISHLAEKCT